VSLHLSKKRLGRDPTLPLLRYDFHGKIRRIFESGHLLPFLPGPASDLC
jgi:hypothetical protein